jgi:uncharacterized oxidoreductase
MKTTNNTVLITGGSAGIGFEIAKQLSEKNNHVIIIGRDKERLDTAAAQLKNVTAIVADVSKEADVNNLVKNLLTNFPALNMVINNAGRAIVYKLSATANAFEKAQDEMFTNFFSVIRLNEKLLPLLEKQPEAAIVNVSSVVAFVPGSLPTYSASKAALHSYTQSLRITLGRTMPNIKVFELMPPLVNTAFSKEIGGANGIHPSVVADAFVNGLAKDEYEIHAGRTADIYKLYLSSPAAALSAMNPEPQKS